MTHTPFQQNEIAEWDMIEFEASKYGPEFETAISKTFDDKTIYQERNFQYKQKQLLLSKKSCSIL